MMAGFMALIFVRNITKIEYPIVILLVYACVMAMLADHDETIALAVSFVPFSAAFQYRYALLALIIIYAVKHWREMKKLNLYAYIPLALMMCWEAAHALLGDFSIVLYLQGFSELIFCSFVISLPNKKFDYSLISRVLAVAVVFCCCVSLSKLLETVDYDFEAIFQDSEYRFGVVDENVGSYGLNYNSNALGFMCNIGMLGLLLRMAKYKANILDIILVVAQIALGFLTISRSFTICLILSFVLFIFSISSKTGKLIKFIVSFGAILALALIVINSAAPYIFENLVDRFGADDVTGGRAGLLEVYNEYLFSDESHYLFGTGLQDVMGKVNKEAVFVVNNVPHNGIQELMVVWGIPGIVLFSTFCGMLFFMSSKKHSLSMCNFIHFIVWFAMGMSGQWITSGKDMLMLAFLFIVLQTDFQIRGEKSEI